MRKEEHSVRRSSSSMLTTPTFPPVTCSGRGQVGSERGKALNEIMEKGDLVPLEVVLDLIAEAMLNKVSSSKGFLIDGYPREQAQGVQFEQSILPCTKVLYFEVPDEVMVERLLNRAKTSGRVDDNEETIKKRLATFHKHSEPVIQYYKEKCATIVALASPDEVFAEVQKALSTIQ
nr:adenylate kinase isoenzyme 1-like [Penaeus vannamei]